MPRIQINGGSIPMVAQAPYHSSVYGLRYSSGKKRKEKKKRIKIRENLSSSVGKHEEKKDYTK